MATPWWILSYIIRLRDLRQRCSKVSKIITTMPSKSEADVDTLLAACFDRCLYTTAILVAVRYKRIEQLLSKTKMNYEQESHRKFWNEVFIYLSKTERWSCLKSLLLHCTQCFPESLLIRMATTRLDTEGQAMFRMLLDRSTDQQVQCLRDVLWIIANFELVDQFDIFVYNHNKSIQRVLLEISVNRNFHVHIVKWACKITSESDRSVFAAACEAGLFSQSPLNAVEDLLEDTAFGIAVLVNRPDLIKSLYYAGAATNEMVFQLGRHSILARRCLPNPVESRVKAAREIRDFLMSKASQPRSLESLCLNEVSKRVGWGHVRDVNVAQLQMPNSLKDELSRYWRDINTS